MLDNPAPPPECSADAPATAERRQGIRYYYRRTPLVRYLVRPSFHSGRGFIKDVSANGLGLLINHPLELGSVLFLQLQGLHRGTTRTHLARVVHVTRQGAGRWLVGCQLTCRLSGDELRQVQDGNE